MDKHPTPFNHKKSVDFDALLLLMKQQPELAAQVAELFELTGKGLTLTADQAEAEIQRRLAPLANETLQSWAQKAADSAAFELGKFNPKHVKKK
jgi:hypothetical protein